MEHNNTGWKSECLRCFNENMNSGYFERQRRLRKLSKWFDTNFTGLSDTELQHELGSPEFFAKKMSAESKSAKKSFAKKAAICGIGLLLMVALLLGLQQWRSQMVKNAESYEWPVYTEENAPHNQK